MITICFITTLLRDNISLKWWLEFAFASSYNNWSWLRICFVLLHKVWFIEINTKIEHRDFFKDFIISKFTTNYFNIRSTFHVNIRNPTYNSSLYAKNEHKKFGIKWFTCWRVHLQTFNLTQSVSGKILNCVQKKDDFRRKIFMYVLLRLAGKCFANIETSQLLVKFWIIWVFWEQRELYRARLLWYAAAAIVVSSEGPTQLRQTFQEYRTVTPRVR